jgi:hypothetical protein
VAGPAGLLPWPRPGRVGQLAAVRRVQVSVAGGLVRREGDSPTNEKPEDVINVMPYSAYPLYQAERPMSDSERRQADAGLGVQAASAARLWRDAARPWRTRARRARAQREPRWLPSRGH